MAQCGNLQKFTLTHFWLKFRESNVFTKETTNFHTVPYSCFHGKDFTSKMISRKIANFYFSPRMYVFTVWKFQAFYTPQILREINFETSSSKKTAILAIFGALNLVDFSFQKVQKFSR